MSLLVDSRSMSTFWNVVLILAGSAVAVGGIFGEGYDRAKLTKSKWWKPWSYVLPRGWVMLGLTALVVLASVWKYGHDFADAQAKEAQLVVERDEWKKKGDERTKATQSKLDALSGENSSLKLDMKKQSEDFAHHMLTLKEQNDGLAGRAEALRRQLEELKKDSESMVLAMAMAGSTTSASVLKAREDLQKEIQTSADVLHQSVAQYDDALFHLVSDMHQKDVVPMHNALDGRGHSEEDLPTLKNVREECASPVEIENVLKGPAGKALVPACPACACTCTGPSQPPPAAAVEAKPASPPPTPSTAASP